jgi:hypothetical protein
MLAAAIAAMWAAILSDQRNRDDDLFDFDLPSWRFIVGVLVVDGVLIGAIVWLVTR